MTLQRVQGTAPITDVEFRLSDHMTTRGITIDADLIRTGMYVANEKILKGGTEMAEVTATGLYGPVKKTTLKTAANATDTSVTLTDARFFQVGDEIIVGDEAAAIAITAINYATGVATLESGLTGNQAKDVTIKVATGEETAVGILMNTVNLTDGDVAASIMTHGVVKASRLLGHNALTAADLTKIEFR